MIRFRTYLTFLLTHPAMILGLMLVLLLGAPFLSSGTVQILTFLMLNIMLAQSMNLLTGIAGQISLGHAGFYGMGAYASGILMKTVGLDVEAFAGDLGHGPREGAPSAEAAAAIGRWGLPVDGRAV